MPVGLLAAVNRSRTQTQAPPVGSFHQQGEHDHNHHHHSSISTTTTTTTSSGNQRRSRRVSTATTSSGFTSQIRNRFQRASSHSHLALLSSEQSTASAQTSLHRYPQSPSASSAMYSNPYAAASSSSSNADNGGTPASLYARSYQQRYNPGQQQGNGNGAYQQQQQQPGYGNSNGHPYGPPVYGSRPQSQQSLPINTNKSLPPQPPSNNMHHPAGAAYDQYLSDPSSGPGSAQKRRGRDWLPYQGERQLIIAIDLGTTYSGASFCVLEPGKKPKIEDVKSYPAQATGLSKVPSVVTYDRDCNARLFGAEAEGTEADLLINEGGYQVRWWKLHLRPPHLRVILAGGEESTSNLDLDPLPPGVTVEQVCANFLAYMVKCVGTYIFTRLANGREILTSLGQRTSYVVTIPNGWEIAQQQTLRQACVMAQLIPAERAESAIRFVTEAEASICYLAMSQSAGDMFDHYAEGGGQLIVNDAGGGTIDVSTYTVEAIHPNIQVKENGISDCIIAGSTTVDQRALLLIQERLRGTRWDNYEDLRSMRQMFSTTIKETFASRDQGEILLRIGMTADNDPSIGLRKGMLVFTAEEVAELYEPSIAATCQSIEGRIVPRQDGRPAMVAMVGGFSESMYFRSELALRLGEQVQLCKPDEATAKAVASGALIWALDGVVGSRVARMSYGIRCSCVLRPERPAHQARAHLAYGGVDGVQHLSGAFGCVLRKGETGRDDEEHLSPFVLTWTTTVPLTAAISLLIYRGESGGANAGMEADELPEFVDMPGFAELCVFNIDMTPFQPLLPVLKTPQGQEYVKADIELAMKLTGTEISAQVLFRHEGNLYRGPVNVAAAQPTV
ncbi:hypothetical protein CF327_g1722 [Tilletia walkeri]|nr:hypothetical protein CF327_g1722 [Tilletia walkeri]